MVTYVHKAMYSVQNRPREGELGVNAGFTLIGDAIV